MNDADSSRNLSFVGITNYPGFDEEANLMVHNVRILRDTLLKVMRD